MIIYPAGPNQQAFGRQPSCSQICTNFFAVLFFCCTSGSCLNSPPFGWHPKSAFFFMHLENLPTGGHPNWSGRGRMLLEIYLFNFKAKKMLCNDLQPPDANH